MDADAIKWGETYEIRVNWIDADDQPIVLTAENPVACRVTRKIGGDVFIDPPATVIDGGINVVFDTGDDPWCPGIYYIDTRMTTLDGKDYWSDITQLTLKDRNTPNT